MTAAAGDMYIPTGLQGLGLGNVAMVATLKKRECAQFRVRVLGGWGCKLGEGGVSQRLHTSPLLGALPCLFWQHVPRQGYLWPTTGGSHSHFRGLPSYEEDPTTTLNWFRARRVLLTTRVIFLFCGLKPKKTTIGT